MADKCIFELGIGDKKYSRDLVLIMVISDHNHLGYSNLH